MSRVELIGAADAPLTSRRYFEQGDPGPIVSALAQVPEVLEVALPFIATVLGPSAVDARIKELVILRTSAVLGCRYCVETHTVVALDTGLTPDEVRAVRGDIDRANLFPVEREARLLTWVDAVALGVGPLDASVAGCVATSFTDHEIVELTLLAGATIMLNRFCTALELPTSPDVLARLAREGLR
jgi:AhpD family alkylhydroperoxidase